MKVSTWDSGLLHHAVFEIDAQRAINVEKCETKYGGKRQKSFAQIKPVIQLVSKDLYIHRAPLQEI